MLDENSALKRVPAVTNPKQALFIDGIRHSFEIIEFAYKRLQLNLTGLAVDPPKPSRLQNMSSLIFLDAWAMIDAIDRFRILYQNMPGMKLVKSSPDVQPLAQSLETIRQLRNVADHLSQRADYVVARDGAALGSLSWFTGFKKEPPALWSCTLRPGTLRSEPVFKPPSVPKSLDWPTGGITLKAGGFEGNLSGSLFHIELRIRHFESQLDQAFKEFGPSGTPVCNDFFAREPCREMPNDFSWS